MKIKRPLQKKSQRGFALMTVFILTTVLLIMVLSLISLTSQTLYRATADVERACVVPLTESAVNEARIMLVNNPSWGKANETLFMCSGGQDITRARLEPGQAPTTSNNNFSFGEKGCYYITFNKNDSKFFYGSPVYYSVNNLQSKTPADNWRGAGKVPPYTASIVVTAAVGNTVKHLEVILRAKPETAGFENGSRGSMKLTTSSLAFRKTGTSSAPNIHSNFASATNSVTIVNPLSASQSFNLDNPIGATVSGNKGIDTPSKISNPYKASWLNPGAGEKDVPDFDPNNMLSKITFEPNAIPSGTYKVNSTTGLLDYWHDGLNKTKDLPTKSYSAGEIVPGLDFKYDTETITTKYRDWWGRWQTRITTYQVPKLLISKDLQVAYDSYNPTAPGTTGNLQIEEVSLNFTVADKTLYLPGDSAETADASGNYQHGNLTVTSWGSTDEASGDDFSQDLISGEGNICTMGGMNLFGARIYAGSGSETKAFYARGDVEMQTIDQVKINALVYTNGSFNATVGFSDDDVTSEECAKCHDDGTVLKGHCTRGKTRTDKNSDLNRTLEIDGAIIVAGDPNDPNSGTMNIKAIDQFNLTFNDNVLKNLASSTGYTRIISWHEF